MSTAAAVPPLEGELTTWGLRHTLGVGAILVGIVCVGGLLPYSVGAGRFHDARLVAWLAILALFLALAVVVGHGITGLYRGVFIDDRHMLSLSRVQMFLWTVLVLSAYLSAALANVGRQAADPLAISVPQTLLQAMGLGTISLVAAPAVLHGARKRAVATKPTPADSRWTDLVSGEEEANRHTLDLAKLQLLLVTIVLVLGYAIVLGDSFVDSASPAIRSLPKIDDAFVVMLGISHVGYLTKKAVPSATVRAAKEG